MPNVQFFNGEDVQKVFKDYDKPLRTMFKFYASFDQTRLDQNIELQQNSLSQSGFIKFGNLMNLTPTLLTFDNLLQTFKVCSRQRIKDKDLENNPELNLQVLDYDVSVNVLTLVLQKSTYSSQYSWAS